MILVDVYVPSVGNSYDFQLDEMINVGILIEEISEMIGQKEHSEITGAVKELLLCDKASRRVLAKNKGLAAQEIKTGSSLILV